MSPVEQWPTCNEWLGHLNYCGRPAVGEVKGSSGGGPKCEQHIKGWPERIVTRW